MTIFNSTKLPLIEYLGNAAIENEHWAEIATITGVDVIAKYSDSKPIVTTSTTNLNETQNLSETFKKASTVPIVDTF